MRLDSLAARGDADAMFTRALLHLDGIANLQNHERALRLLESAAASGHAASKLELGLLHQTGTVAARDATRAYRLIAEAANQGLAEAQYRLAVANIYGIGTTENPAEARRWLAPAADAGHQEAQFALALMLLSTHGGPKNEFAARRWLASAAAGADTAVATKSDRMAGELDKRLLFSGAFRPENVVAAIAATIGLAVIISKLFPGDPSAARASSSGSTPGADPINPTRFTDFPSTHRRQRCWQEFWYGGMTPQGRDAIGMTGRTFTKCVYE